MAITVSDQIYFKNQQIMLTDDSFENFITLQDGLDYEMRYLNGTIPGNKGGHSNILLLINPDSGEIDDDTLIMKICVYHTADSNTYSLRRRFTREIIALRKAKDARAKGVVQIYEWGDLIIDGNQYHYYIMEYANNDLANHLVNNKVDIQQKIVLCNEILDGIGNLHDLNIYHRDIKHDNMLICGGLCKVGDLGLVKFREDDKFDEYGSRIGAFGWESPETMNKYYAERAKKPAGYTPTPDCVLDEKSDVFQLGKLFWYIFVGVLPIGQLDYSDFTPADQDLYNLLRGMLLQSKNNRLDLRTVKQKLEPISKRYYAA